MDTQVWERDLLAYIGRIYDNDGKLNYTLIGVADKIAGAIETLKSLGFKYSWRNHATDGHSNDLNDGNYWWPSKSEYPQPILLDAEQLHVFREQILDLGLEEAFPSFVHIAQLPYEPDIEDEWEFELPGGSMGLPGMSFVVDVVVDSLESKYATGMVSQKINIST